MDGHNVFLNLVNGLLYLPQFIACQCPIVGVTRKPKLSVVYLHGIVHQIAKMRKISFCLLGAHWVRIQIDKQASDADESAKKA